VPSTGRETWKTFRTPVCVGTVEDVVVVEASWRGTSCLLPVGDTVFRFHVSKLKITEAAPSTAQKCSM
jgi:hypothetical protein